MSERDLPDCCFSPIGAEWGQVAYAAYNRAGDRATAGLNYQGKPCPSWEALPENVREKWRASANVIAKYVEDEQDTQK